MTPYQLRSFRERLKLTQKAFAEKIGVQPNTIARWERGELGMRETTRRYIEALKQTIDLTKPDL